ncbi:HEAT repeat domain-containing protein, partial [Micromonospora sonneratiae]
MTDDLFTGLDKIRWSRLRHAYGSAAEVPDLLRGLVDPDPAVREVALDGMYGAVHHQGDVYPCTIAAIPFLLRIAQHPGSPGRAAVVQLLASIGSAEDPTELTGHHRRANQAVAEAYPLWVTLLEDPDPEVRAAATAVLPACPQQAPATVTRLLDRLSDEDEDDPTVRAAIVRVAAELARLAGDTTAVRERLTGMLSTDPDPRLQLVALAELAELAASPSGPTDQPMVGVDDALPLLTAVYQAGTPATPPAGFETGTLIGAVRLLHEQSNDGRRSPGAANLVRSVSASFGNRVPDRVRLLTALLRSPDWECRLDALFPASNLVDGWRGDYAELISLVGDQVGDGQPQLCSRAVQVLENLGGVAAPAADALATVLAATAERVAPHSRTTGQTPWVIEWAQALPTVGPALRALSGAGDPRALPMLAWALDLERMPRDVGYLVAQFGDRAAPLVPGIRRRLGDLPTDEPHDDRRDSLAAALARIGPATADALPELLDLPVTPAVQRALAAIG